MYIACRKLFKIPFYSFSLNFNVNFQVIIRRLRLLGRNGEEIKFWLGNPCACNAVKSVSSTHQIRRVTHNVISNHRQAFYLKANVLSSSRTKSSPSYSTSNPSFSPIVTASRNIQHISLSAKFCIFFMMFFNVTLLKQSIRNILVFNILVDLFLLLLVYLRFYSGTSDRLSFYFKLHKHFFKPSFDCFLICSIIKVTCNINTNNFGLHLKAFTLLTVYLLLFLANKFFVDVAYKYLISGKNLNKS